MSGHASKAIFWGGSLAGVLDITAAFVIWSFRNVRPIQVLQAIAAGVLGIKSFRGGLATAVLGGFLHFLIAFTVAAVYYLASRKVPFMTRQTLISGLMYGIVVYVFMYFVALPLSAAVKVPFSPRLALAELGVHILCIGVPVAIIVRQFSN